jgi:hypothetical protein
MLDREKVLTWLEICGKDRNCSGTCPYSEHGFGEYGECKEQLMEDAFDLLKEDCHNCKLECLLQKYDELKEEYDYEIGLGLRRSKWMEQVVELKRRSHKRKEGSWGSRIRAKNNINKEYYKNNIMFKY